MTAAVAAQLVGTLSGCWALGYGIGKAVAWTRHIVNAA